jgi:peptidoglycan/xylan/chitin deacetylase (PgdA/CDA1 family)
MYHAIGASGEDAARFVLPVSAFAAQMRLLAALRFRVVRLDEAVRALGAGENLPRRAVALTFDDGTDDLRLAALPVLERHDFPATAFVVTQAMGTTVGWTEHVGIAGRDTLTWDDALTLSPLITLQPHTRTHASLRGLADDALLVELAGSRRDVEEKTGRAADVFAYPYGHYDSRVVAAVAEAGYAAACTVKPGVNDSQTPRYELRRYEVPGDTSLRAFAAFLLRSS